MLVALTMVKKVGFLFQINSYLYFALGPALRWRRPLDCLNQSLNCKLNVQLKTYM